MHEKEAVGKFCRVLDSPRFCLAMQGKYEDTNNLRYFGNEKIRMSNLFEKKKLEPNVKRMSQKIRRAGVQVCACMPAFVHVSVCVRSECRSCVHASVYSRGIDSKGRNETVRSCLYQLGRSTSSSSQY